jgi:predicted nucleic acid-binding protein
MILVDTNVLGRLCHANDPFRKISIDALRHCRRLQDPMVIVPQTLYEFWVTATRPRAVNGLEMSFDRASRWLQHFQNAFQVLRDPARLFDEWQAIVQSHQTLGKKAHDARLVAAMRLHGVRSILTFNVSDFTRYDITIVDPQTFK